MSVRVYTVYSRILGIFRPATGHHAQREPLTALGDGDGRVVARGAGPEDGAATWRGRCSVECGKIQGRTRQPRG